VALLGPASRAPLPALDRAKQWHVGYWISKRGGVSGMLSALSDLFGPIFAKELVEMSRRGRYYLSRVIYGSILLFVLFVIYQIEYARLQVLGASIHLMSQMAEDFFLAVLWVQYWSVLFFVPLSLCGVIAGEREQKTLELLFTSALSNREIVFGKLGSRIAATATLVLTGLPVIALSMLFGGVNPTILWQTMLATLTALLFIGSLSIYFSATTRSPMGALIRTYWWGMLWLFGVPFVVRLIVLAVYYSRTGYYEETSSYLLLANPIGCFQAAVDRSEALRLSSIFGEWVLAKLMIGPIALSILLLLLTIRAVRRDPVPARWRTWLKSLFVRKKRQPLDNKAQAQTASKAWTKPQRWLLVFPVRNPLWLRARRARVYDRERHLRRMQTGAWLLVAIIIGLFGYLDVNDLQSEIFSMLFHGFAWLGFAVVITLVAGFSIIGDRRRGFFELVLATPMRPGEIINGTFLAVWRHVTSSYRLLITLGIFFAITGATYFYNVMASLLTGTLMAVLIVLHGIACSLAARSIAGALIGTFVFPLVTLFGTMMLMSLAGRLHGPILWVNCAFLLPMFWIFSLVRPSVANIALFLTMVHLTIASAFSAWTYFQDETIFAEYPLSAMHAGYITVSALEGEHPFPWRAQRQPIWTLSLFLYWAALALNILWLRWWLERNFDRLCGRKMPKRPKRQPLDPADELSRVPVT
jgi:ABC-type transport system involved in multi-copper enzyme maturation permease subunit